MKLSQFQHAMTERVLNQTEQSTLDNYLKDYHPKERQERLAIYQNNTFHSLIEVIKDHYPTLKLTIGENLLAACARAYIDTHPPSTPIMQEFALDFPEFLSDFDPVQSTPYLSDLAKVDLLQHLSYHSEDEAPVPAASFAEIDINTLASSHIKPLSSAFLLRSAFAVFDMWQLANGERNDKVEAEQQQNLLVIRPQAQVEVYCLDDGLYTFLTALNQNANVYEALEQATEEAADFSPTQGISFLIQSGFAAHIIGDTL